MFELCASILAANPENLARDVQDAETAGVDAFHIDLMKIEFNCEDVIRRALEKYGT